MEVKGNISDYRSKLEKTLASPNLTNDQKLQSLVRNQILQSSNLQSQEYNENVVETRSREVSDFLSTLRSTSAISGWKVKQDTEEFRVMYQEGTPFHTLLVEGYVDGPPDVCLCISWETSPYSKWWPQSAIPMFKIISSKCLQRIRSGEQISIVRMKVSWPLSSRGAVLHYFAFEYFEDDLIVVLLNSISNSETTVIPSAEEVVRIDLVGGVAFQKVVVGRSYFRVIVSLDVKLEYVPPSLINFISRQLLGSGFKLFKKEVASVIKGDEAFREALKDPFYSRVRQAFGSENLKDVDVMFRGTNEVNEDEESIENDDKSSKTLLIDQIGKKGAISPEVEQALETLENAIFVFRINGVNSTNLETKCVQESIALEGDDEMSRNSSKIGMENHGFRQKGWSCYISETKQNKKMGQDSRKEDPSNSNHISLDSCNNIKTSSQNAHVETSNAMSTKKNKKFWFCCLHDIHF